MKIVFWSPMHGQACTTANMLAGALTASIVYEKNSLITQSHYNLNNLEVPLIGRINEKEFYRDTGLDALMRCIKSSEITKEILYNCSVSIIKNQLSLLIGTRQRSRDIFEADLTKLMRKIINVCNEHYDLVFIDTNSGTGGLSVNVLEEADIIVVNLRQNEEMLTNYFETHDKWLYDKFINSKTFYLIGTYDKDSKYNINNLRRRYKKLNRNNSGVIPYNIEFSDSFSEGSLLKYFNLNIKSDEDNIADEFFYEVHKSLCKIMKLAGIDLYKH